MARAALAALGLFSLMTGALAGQERSTAPVVFERKNTWTVFSEYSNSSSRILVGSARGRKLATLGGAYTRRVVRFKGTELGYQLELRPVLFESDPVAIVTETLSTPTVAGSGVSSSTYSSPTVGVCHPSSSSVTEPAPSPFAPLLIDTTTTCGRQWTFGEAFSPFGFKYSMGIRHRVQPFFIGTLGYMYTSRPVPLTNAESFNFIIDVGAGVEIYRAGTRSLAFEARVHHFSNRDTAEANPGTDNLVYRVSYSFGR